MDENTGLNEFMEAFDDTADYQTGGEEETSMEEAEATETDSEEQTNAETQGDGEATEETNAEQPDGEEKSATDIAGKEETFTLKVNKEEKTYSREEVITLAQKGADYDRVKDQLSQSRQEVTSLQEQISGQQEAMEVLADLAKDAGTDVPSLLKNLRIGLLKKEGLSEDAANERLLRLQAEKENATLRAAAATETPAKETGADRAKRELAEFREVYPETELTQELLDKLMEDVQGGMSLLKAYQKHEAASKDAQIAELRRQLAAEKQNKANAAASPGSQKDSGGKRQRDTFDDFFDVFNK